jgi:hypothetical protein
MGIPEDALEMNKRVVMIDAHFPELRGGACYQRGKGVAGSTKAAGAMAIRDLLAQPKLRRKRFTTFSATVSIGTLMETDPTGNRP